MFKQLPTVQRDLGPSAAGKSQGVRKNTKLTKISPFRQKNPGTVRLAVDAPPLGPQPKGRSQNPTHSLGGLHQDEAKGYLMSLSFKNII